MGDNSASDLPSSQQNNSSPPSVGCLANQRPSCPHEVLAGNALTALFLKFKNVSILNCPRGKGVGSTLIETSPENFSFLFSDASFFFRNSRISSRYFISITPCMSLLTFIPCSLACSLFKCTTHKINTTMIFPT